MYSITQKGRLQNHILIKYFYGNTISKKHGVDVFILVGHETEEERIRLANIINMIFLIKIFNNQDF